MPNFKSSPKNVEPKVQEVIEVPIVPEVVEVVPEKVKTPSPK